MSLDGQVHFYGSVYDEQAISDLLTDVDICVAPGDVGLTCMHSLVYGTPVIIHDNPDFQMPEYEAINPWQNGLFSNGLGPRFSEQDSAVAWDQSRSLRRC